MAGYFCQRLYSAAIGPDMEAGSGLEADLWRRIKTGNDGRATEQIVLHYAGWAAAIARNIHRRVPAYAVDCDDFIQNARIGLMEAVSRYDPDRGVPFQAFAKPRVRGAVFNGLRAIMGERPHEVRDAVYEERLGLLLEDSPADPFDRVVEAILGLGTAFLLDDRHSSADPVAYAGQAQLQRLLHSHVSLLAEQKRLVIELHYFKHVPFVDIAASLGLTKGRISQVHSAALKELRTRLSDPAPTS